MNLSDSLGVLKMELTQNLVPQLLDLLSAAWADGRPIHEVENDLWDVALQVGRHGLGAFLDGHGTGDLGPSVTLPDGRQVERLVWWEFVQRNPQLKRPTVCLCDGQEALWQACADSVLDDDRVEILDLLHVTPRLWAAAKSRYGEKSTKVLPCVRQRVTQLLEGKVETVLRTLRRLAHERRLPAAKKKALSRICSYLHKNRQRLRYDEYLCQGYPIASGVIEGACRHLIKDRLERAGMHWTLAGAQAMLDLRSVWIGGSWEAFQQERITRETERLYPHRGLVAGEAFFALPA